jgi:transcriptional regulator with XRE-family HTH domain
MSNPVRSLRLQAGLTQEEMAARAGTSQPTIAAYEAGVKSPTLATLKRMAAALGFDMAVSFMPELTREDRRSLAYHESVAAALRKDPEAGLSLARRYLERAGRAQPGAIKLWRKWEAWLALPLDGLIGKLLDSGVEARDMRQVSPFAGLLSPRERVRVLKRFRRELGA